MMEDRTPVVLRSGARLDITVQRCVSTVRRAARSGDPEAKRWLAAWFYRDYARIYQDFDEASGRAASRRRRLVQRAAFGSHTEREWQLVLKRYGYRCAACGDSGPLERDHIVPLCAGGCDLALNLQPLCKPCNSAKCGRLLPGTQLSIFDRVRIGSTNAQRINPHGSVFKRFRR